MTEKKSIDHQEDKAPLVTILPVGNPIPLQNKEAITGSLLQKDSPVEHIQTNAHTLETGEDK